MKHIVRNGVKLSNMTLGTAQLGMNYGVANTTGKPSDDDSLLMLQSALASGVSSFDTASGYGDSELRLGKFFQSPFFSGELPYITTKLRTGITPPLPGMSMLPESELRRLARECLGLGGAMEKKVFEGVEQSLMRLNLPKVNCVMLHDPIEMLVGGEPLAKAMGRLVAAGYTDEVGASVYLPAEVDAMLSHDEYTATQLPTSLFDQRLVHSGALAKLKDKDCLVFVRSVFLQGVFFLDPDSVDDPLLVEHAVPHIRALRQLAQEEGISVAQLAISFVRDTPGVTSLVLGCDTEQQLLENTKLMEGPPVSEKTMETARKAFKGINYEGIMTVLRRVKD